MSEPNGLLAIGGDLSPARLLKAYRLGIFPWYNQEPILWWSPDPRTVLFLDKLHIAKSLQKFLRKKPFIIKADQQFAAVLRECAAPRLRQGKWERGTWLNKEMQKAYQQLHEMGYAHSIEVYANEDLVGGLYGISIGKIFFGESMFSRQTHASKVALIALAQQLRQWGFLLIDCQMPSPLLQSMGAESITRQSFNDRLAANNKLEDKVLKWQLAPNLIYW